MKLLIAEKPSLGRAIADWCGVVSKRSGYIVCKNELAVTWVFGHLLVLNEPGDYRPEWKNFSCSLPMIPEKFVNKVRDDSGVKNQLNTIKELLERCTEVINAGDPDREGQLLVDEVLDYLENTKPVNRLWLSAIDDVSIERAWKTIKPNSDYAGFKAAAEVRQQSDWLIGMNYSRAFKTLFSRHGYQTTISIGRVQTPTLKLIVDRDREIKDFVAKDFYELFGIFGTDSPFRARLQLPDEIKELCDDENRLLDKTPLLEIAATIQDKTGTVKLYKESKKTRKQPLLYNLSALQVEANRKHGYSAQQVLDLTQLLYENKLASYPRTDCQYLPESQFDDAPKIIGNLLRASRYKAFTPDTSIKSAAWNDKKVAAHHAIIPTGANLEALPALAKQHPGIIDVFQLIALQYFAQFYPELKYDEREIIITIEGYDFRAVGTSVTDLGWKALFVESANGEEDSDTGDDEENNLPKLRKGQKVLCTDTLLKEKKTTKPKHYTEGTLIKAMTNIHSRVPELLRQLNYDQAATEKLVAEYRSILKESAGLGTEATRAGIIENLCRRAFVDKKAKYLISTELGERLIDSFTGIQETSMKLGFLANPLTTATYELLLDEIVQECKAAEQSVAAGKFWEKLLLQLKDLAGFQQLQFTINAVEGSVTCPPCGSVLRQLNGKYGAYWKCDGCNRNYKDANGQPDITKIPAPKINLNKKCPKCEQGMLVERTGQFGKFVSCNRFPECRYKQ